MICPKCTKETELGCFDAGCPVAAGRREFQKAQRELYEPNNKYKDMIEEIIEDYNKTGKVSKDLLEKAKEL